MKKKLLESSKGKDLVDIVPVFAYLTYCTYHYLGKFGVSGLFTLPLMSPSKMSSGKGPLLVRTMDQLVNLA